MNIAVRNLGFSYPNGKEVFRELNFDITQGRILSILGPNGAGNSTLLGCIAGLYTPKTGDILLEGKSYRRMSQREIACAIGFVPQNIIPSFNYSVLDYIVTGCAPHMGVFQKPKAAEYERAWKAIQAMGLEHIAEQSFMKISGGERQQVAIARVMVQKPSIILLDEPTSHLDFGNQMKVLEMVQRLRAEGYGIVMTTHNPDHVLLLDDQVTVLDRNGKLTFGMSQEILDEAFLFNLYGRKLRLFQIDELGRRVCVPQGIS
ncbi:ABC transporter ATP-binding protein [Clostridium formicaceticum]|uniref:ABC transporter ATP-binding protein n=2 Tax=Clostridium formicaceticum TaxID=1497 RepID=A0AAC9WFA4_9CLOT|nr:ABC transporter ATP-binding protein [Clostridium formicaceticum]AOY76280.1 iron ABC transporter ATP-binding protein [Clostridium formicaceticum]ARE86667.1 putative ABC transporter ATP-binding protein [Clostridium formicaceticum]